MENVDHSSTSSENSITATLTPFTPPAISPLTHAHHFISLKLNTQNYLLWRTQLVLFLRGQKLLGFVDGSHPCSSLTLTVDDHSEPNPVALLCKEQDQLLLSLLMSSLSEFVIPLVVGLNTSHEVWCALEFAFASPSNTHILHLHMQMQRPQASDESAPLFFNVLKQV
ncbi:UBN2_3 domain-containing protein [Cephalotus follicularis]|uniref:UBN2_3 domain-containing protein n=1 Tax=Cephalotus follicularis TaxID=3775 RepID=A0A1Q3CLZ6_CEPFO|nr:UBN2_3 domain-containing protein [Cephalotus follicularis]